MGSKHYPDEFRRSAVELYRDNPTATIAGIAKDLGCSKHALAAWINAAGVPMRGTRGSRPAVAVISSETPQEELVRLRTENQALRAEKTKLTTERDILRQAARYFAGETRW